MPDAIGRSLPPLTFKVTNETLVAYARSIEAPVSGPPLLPFLLPIAFGPARRNIAEDIPVQMFIHLVGGEVDLRAGDAPINPGDAITTAGRVADVRHRIQGDLWVVDTASTNQEGEMVGEMRLTFLVPPASAEKRLITDTLPPLVTRERPATPAMFDFVRVRPVEADAAMAGIDFFRGETAAVGHAAAAIVEAVGGGDAARLKRISAKVTGTVMFGRSLVIHGKRGKNPGQLSFECLDEKGAGVLSDGVAEIIE
jgi:hypothetical protein